MTEERKGIAAAGNWIVDITKIIDVYPEQDTLANIQGQSSNNGGAPYNLLKDLARLGAPFPLKAVGLVGRDGPGERIVEDCRKHAIDITGITFTEAAGTSYTDVMLVKKTGRRTFFHYRGANALLDLPHFDWGSIDARIFHLGYLLLLDKLDEIRPDSRTNASLLLEEAGNQGMLTSVDLVSEHSDRFRRIINPSLPYIDILFCNEYEAGKLSGIPLDPDHMDTDKIRAVIRKCLDGGVRQWVILHFPAGCAAGHRNGDLILQGSVDLPPSAIVGTTGAGDAFAAGVLYGLHERWTMEECLRSGVCSAAMSLTDASCSDGIPTMEQCMQRGEQYGYRKLG